MKTKIKISVELLEMWLFPRQEAYILSGEIDLNRCLVLEIEGPQVPDSEESTLVVHTKSEYVEIQPR